MRPLSASGQLSNLDSSHPDILGQIEDILRGIQSLLAQIVVEYNSEVYTTIGTLPQGRADVRWRMTDDSISPKVHNLDGANIFVDTNASTITDGGKYWRTDKTRPKTIKEALNAIYLEISNAIGTIQIQTSSGLTEAIKARIGINIFDPTQTSSPTSLDGLTQSNQMHLLQLARDLYDDSYDSWTSNGAALLTNSIRDHLVALLSIHNGVFDTDLTLSHDDIEGTILAVEDEGSTIELDTQTIDFVGTGVSVSSMGGNKVQVTVLGVITGSGNPNGTETGYLGQLYWDTANSIFYRCTDNPSGTTWEVA